MGRASRTNLLRAFPEVRQRKRSEQSTENTQFIILATSRIDRNSDATATRDFQRPHQPRRSQAIKPHQTFQDAGKRAGRVIRRRAACLSTGEQKIPSRAASKPGGRGIRAACHVSNDRARRPPSTITSSNRLTLRPNPVVFEKSISSGAERATRASTTVTPRHRAFGSFAAGAGR